VQEDVDALNIIQHRIDSGREMNEVSVKIDRGGLAARRVLAQLGEDELTRQPHMTHSEHQGQNVDIRLGSCPKSARARRNVMKTSVQSLGGNLWGLKNLAVPVSRENHSGLGQRRVRTSTRLKAVAGTALVGGMAALAEASASAAALKSGTIKIGYVTPSTGSLADFAGPDKFVLSLVRSASQFAKGITIGKTKYKIEVTVKNSQSDRRSPVPSRRADPTDRC